MPRTNTPESFWARVGISTGAACWEWSGAITSSGYGNLSWNGKNVQAHRVAYLLARGGVSPETNFRLAGRAKSYKRFVLHKCDNRKCCNPGHLFLGSMRANQLDAYAKGRKTQPKSGHVNAKLTPQAVRDIRTQYAAGTATQAALAFRHGVSQRAISLVVRNETYMDIK